MPADAQTRTVDQILAGWPSTFDTMGDARKMQEMVEYARTLERLLRKVLDTREAEAKAQASYNVAADNFSDAAQEGEVYERAMLAASEAEDEAREALKGARV